MTDNIQVRDVIDKETLSRVKSVGDTYKYGFSTDIETEYAPLGLNEDIVRLISKKNSEPEWMLEWRLKAFNRWIKLKQPDWALLKIPQIDFQDQYYYARPAKMKEKPKSLDEVDPKLLETYTKLGIPLTEQKKLAGVLEDEEERNNTGRKVAIDAVFDSVSVGTTFKEELKAAGVIFCSISEAIKDYPDLVKKFKVTRPTIYSWMEKGLLKKIPIGGRVLFHPNDINELIDRLRGISS